MGNKGRKSNAIQFLHGLTNEITVPVKTGKALECQEITRGDPIFIHQGTVNAGENGYAFPIGKLTTASLIDQGHKWFTGISMSDSKDGESKAIRVATTGVFEVPLNTSTTVKVGDIATYVTGVGASSGSVDVDAVSKTVAIEYAKGIGKIVEAGSSVSTVKVQIHSRMINGSLDLNIS